MTMHRTGSKRVCRRLAAGVAAAWGFSAVGPLAQEIPLDAKQNWAKSEALIAEGRRTGDVETLLEAARLRDAAVNPEWIENNAPQEEWNVYFNAISQGAAENGLLSATDILDAVPLPADETPSWSALLKKLRKHVIVPALNRATYRRWPMVNGGRIAFDLRISSARDLKLQVVSVRHESQYTIMVQHEDGQTICASKEPKFQFECSWRAEAPGNYDIQITSMGPLASTMQLLVN